MGYRAIGIDDSVNSCDCCGKSNLKSTVTMMSDTGEIVHYGSVCATRNSGKDNKTIKKEISDDLASRKIQAIFEYIKSQTFLDKERKINHAHELNLVGVEFKKYCLDEFVKDDITK